MQTITISQIYTAILQTLYMIFIPLLIGSVVGTLLGVLMVVTRPNGILENKYIYNVLNPIVNIFRSLPFIILMVAIVPFTKLIVGSSIGTSAALVPLTIFITPYIARLVENSILEVDSGTIEAAEAMGATSFQIIWHFLLPEAMGSLVLSLTTATIGLIGATAMAGTVGGGGIGDVAISYGYERFDTEVMVITVILLIIFVQFIQTIGNVIARKVRRN
ncbi:MULTISPECIES: methionine ABC transporter permease [Clostridium]|uniref:D-methionine transport system permease protein MetI n=3 Tax=Clostridium TaxID=1485 RepID=D8GN83_CLOLD|nr:MULTISPECIES: methionine ABC transporter permease [Clostridium]ADK13707.1 predicted ABC-type transporter, permease component [Clostridium ljungdahlii DSM 13528]AGY76932.1 ABC transporter permease [Clostridium autoethanogenum DSM 10061]ALU37077.1 ABC-type transporter integral membrane subunit [Clostridium autoethanogenum DSM 10061]OAA83743.1 D-methionine transport system permease protein MetI [Clostridium ljungdahlii DSM 13528]OVY48531.1 D-methionine transport system permease protein MetI [C